MKKVVSLALLMSLIVCTISAKSATAVPSKAWSRVQVDPAAMPVAQDQTPVIRKEASISPMASATITNNPDVAVTTATNTTQSENSIFVSPTNPSIILNSNNSSNWPVSAIFGSSFWVSTNGGSTWTGSTAGAGGANNGDPATAIDLTGRMYIAYISSTGGMGVSFSTNNGSTWTARTVSSTASLDKEHLWVDNSASSAFSGRLYDAWSNFLTGHANVNDIEISRSTDGGVTWSAAQNISNAINAGSHNQGVNIQTGPNGEVYVAWAIYDSWPANEVALGFTKSLDGGVTWTAPVRIRTINGTRNTSLGGSKTMRHASYPSMAVNQQTGQIHIVWTNIGVPGTGTGDFEVYTISSSNGGTTWSSPIKVNQDAQGNGKDQWMPWLACDPVTGDLSCIFYDSRNFVSNNACEAFVAVSQDNGATWSDAKVSDFSWSGDGILGFSGNYAGDYLGISARSGNVVPCWSDDHSGNMLAYVSPFTLTSGPVPPTAQFAGSPTVGCAPLTVNFTDQSTGTPTSWSWDFGDGGTSALQNPSYAYVTAGTYTVSLTVANAAGNNTNTKVGYISVSTGVGPVADFTGTPLVGDPPLTVAFTDLSTGTPTSWSWNFGDGGTSTLQNPSHAYTNSGSYQVTLTATNTCGPNTMVKPAYITVNAPPTQCDDFADNNISNWVNSSGTWSATNGVMNGNSNTQNARRTSPFGTFSTFTITADMKMNSTRNQRNARIIFAYTNSTNYRYIEGSTNAGAWRIVNRVGGTNTVVASVADAIATNTWYLGVKVACTNTGLVTLTANGKTVSFNFGSAPNGQVGVGFDRASCNFDNFCAGGTPTGPVVVIGPGGKGDDDDQGEDEREGRGKLGLPNSFVLEQNYPNPFNPTTEISFSIGEASQVSLEIFNVMGEKVRTLAKEYMTAGHHTVVWNSVNDNGQTVSSGVYYYRINAGTFSETKKMLLIK